MGSSPPVCLAVLGAGLFVHHAHLPTLLDLSRLGRVSIAAVWSRTCKSATSLAEKLKDGNVKVAVYDGEEGLKQVLARTDVQAVIVAVPIWRTPEIVKMALAAGKHVLSEKPIAGCVDEARDLLQYYGHLGEGKPMYFVAEHYRFEKAWLKASELVEQHCGKLVAASLVVHVPFSGTAYEATDWRREAKHLGANVMDAGVHYVAGLRTVLKAPVLRVTAAASKKTKHLPKVDTLVGLLEFEGSIFTSFCFSLATCTSTCELRVAGLKGTVRVEKGISNGEGGYWVFCEVSGRELESEFHPFRGVNAEITAYIDHCQGVGRWPGLDPVEAFHDVACIESLLSASDLGKIVEVPKT